MAEIQPAEPPKDGFVIHLFERSLSCSNTIFRPVGEDKGPSKSALKKAAKAAEKEKKKSEKASQKQEQSQSQADADAVRWSFFALLRSLMVFSGFCS